MKFTTKRVRLRSLAPFVLALGLISFFGPTVHVAVDIASPADPVERSAADPSHSFGDVMSLPAFALEAGWESAYADRASGLLRNRVVRPFNGRPTGITSCSSGGSRAARGVALHCLYSVYLI